MYEVFLDIDLVRQRKSENVWIKLFEWFDLELLYLKKALLILAHQSLQNNFRTVSDSETLVNMTVELIYLDQGFYVSDIYRMEQFKALMIDEFDKVKDVL